MAGEMQAQTWPLTTAGTLYWRLRNVANGQIWNTVAAALQAYDTAQIENYDLGATQQGTASGYWVGDMPAAPAGAYTYLLCLQAGADPAESDRILATTDSPLVWDGSAVVNPIDVNVTKWLGTAVATPTTAGVPEIDVTFIGGQAVTCAAPVTVRADIGAAAAPGAANGMLIGGSNAATTFAGLSTGAFSCTTLTASGNVAFQSLFTVTGQVSFVNAFTVLGTVSFQSTFAVTTSTSLGALSCSTFAASGAVTFNSLTVTNAFTVSQGFIISRTSGAALQITASSGAAIQAQGSTYAIRCLGDIIASDVTFSDVQMTSLTVSTISDLGATQMTSLTVNNNFSVSNNFSVGGTTTLTGAVTATNAGNDIRGVTLTQAFPANFATLGITAGGAISNVVLTDTLTTYTGNTPQTGDSFARIGATGSGLTSLAPSATALSTAQWTNPRAALLDNLDAAITTRASATVAPSWYSAAALDMSQALASTTTPGTLGYALNAAVVQGYGRWVLGNEGTTLTLYEADGVTVARVFTISYSSEGVAIARTPQ